MTREDAAQAPEKTPAPRHGSGRNPREHRQCAPSEPIARTPSDQPFATMEAVVERVNMLKALKRVETNRGAPGVDGVRTEALRAFLITDWARIKVELLTGTYYPSAVLGVEIPKPGGGVRQLGIPTAMDRMIQQAIHQVLQPIYEPEFSESSYGFRPGRSAHDAVRQARANVASGLRWVVDMDLEKFFDRVNHDLLISRLRRKVTDKRLIAVIRRYLQAGMMQGGLVTQRVEGAPQGGPLSPLLSNVLLDDLDKELERRGHAFCRYADDCNIYVRSSRAGERVLGSITDWLWKHLRLKVNAEKSAVARPWSRKFLGYSMTSESTPRLKVSPKSVERFKVKVRDLFRQGRGRNLKRFIVNDLNPVLRGWINYYRLTETKTVLEELDQWIRRKLRCVLWRQWKRPLTRFRNLRKRGLSEERARQSASNGRGPWWNSGASHMGAAYPNRTFESMGLISLLNYRR